MAALWKIYKTNPHMHLPYELVELILRSVNIHNDICLHDTDVDCYSAPESESEASDTDESSENDSSNSETEHSNSGEDDAMEAE